MASFEAGSWVWVPDEKEMFLPGKVVKSFKPGEDGQIKYEDGKLYTIPAKHTKECLQMDEAALATYDNMIKLNNLNEPVILHNLRQRFLKDSIYTYVSSILVALNPFKLLPIYTPEIMDKYKDGGGRTQPPHIFAVSDNAYRNLMADFRDQAVVISGESGAGKTETMKLVLQFLADVSGRAQKHSANGEKQESLEQQVLKSNPVMEAFGNAKTTRNNNSSRFGKWTEIKFNRTGAIVGGSIINYLLEKSRIPFQAQQERNYHIFYQLLAGGELDPALKKTLKLRDAEEFRYMNQSGVTTVDSINDEKDWIEMTGAMDVLNMTADEKEQVFRLVAGCLHLGNVDFERDPKGQEETDARVKNAEQNAIAAELLRVPAADLDKCLTYRKITRPGSKSITYAHYSLSKAKDARDACAKALYGKLFDWLIQKINRALVGMVAEYKGKNDLATIGVLDIFGFESFATNSFEQLCINYCNEKLQFHFNEYIFRLEQEEYKAEGIPVDLIEFKDNQPTLDMLEAKATGIFAMIDEEINVPKGTDETMLKKVLAKHAKHSNFAAPKPKDLNANLVFIVIHYAGAVPYNVTNFLEKNKDALHDDIVEVMAASKCPLVSSLMAPPEDAKDAKGAKKKQPTLGFQFKESLGGLMQALYRCEPHFVRCMKSNHQKKGNIFESDMMMAQLRYCGLLEVARIRQIGFPVRKVFDDFLFRYRALDLMAAAGKDIKKFCGSLEAKGFLKPRQWAIGHTKVFMRNKQQEEVEEAREHALKGVVVKIQAAGKRSIYYKRYLRYQAIQAALAAAIKKRTEEALETALSDVPELPHGGDHVPVVKEARKLKERLEEERRCTEMCKEAIKARDLAQLKSAVKQAEDIVFESPVVTEARALRDLMEKEKAAVKKLKDAIAARSLDDLVAAIAHGDGFGVYVTETDTYKQAVSLKERIEAENAARKALKKAMKERSLEALSAALATCNELGLEEDIVKEGQVLKEELEEQKKAMEALAVAVTERVLEGLQAALKRCKKLGITADSHPEYGAAKELEAKLVEEKETEDELHAAAESRDMGRIEKALKKATKMGMPETPGVKKATKALERLKAEEAALDALKKAVKAKKAPALLAALKQANEAGLPEDCKEIAAAKEALSSLGAQSEALMRLEEAVGAGDLTALDAALKECDKMGLGDEEVVQQARDAKKRISKQNKAAAALEAALEAADRDAITSALAAGEELNIAVRFGDLVARAGKKLEAMDAEEALQKAMRAAVEAGDEEALNDAVEKAKAMGASSDTLKAADKASHEMEGRKEVVKKLQRLLDDEDRDREALQAALDEARELGLSGAKVEQAENLLGREKQLKEVRKALRKAQKAADDKALSEALERAISLGMKGEDMDKAKAFKARLDEEKELASGINAAMKNIMVKAEGSKGVKPSDLEPLMEAMEEARAQGLSDDSPFMKKAIEAQERINAVLVIQSEVAKALESDSLRVMKRVLDKAEDADLGNSSLVKKLRSRLREMEKARAKAALADDDGGAEEAVPSLDDEEMKRLREEKMRKASHPKYAFVKYPKIRTPDDFARGVLLNKRKVKQGQLRWAASVIPTSLLDYSNKDLAKYATRIHRNILGYTGDKSMSFPATLAQDILTKGLEIPDLVDEIYLQLCKHLTHNPRPESQVRGWQIMCMCVGTFPPSRDFENYLINFILDHKDGAGAIGNYARYSLRRLEGILNSGPSGFVPSVDEILAYKERPPILATIELVDGTPLTEDLPITPDLSVGKVLDICVHFLELQDPRAAYFGIFVEDVDDPDSPAAALAAADGDDAPPYAGLPKTPRPLQSENFMGDVVTVKVRQNQPFKFVFKRKIYLKNADGPSTDPMYERLIYLQSVDEFVNGNIPVDKADEVGRLVAHAMTVDLGDDMPGDVDDLVAADVMEYVPKPWRSKKQPKDWASLVLKHRDGCLEAEPEAVQARFVEAVKDHPLYGTCFFHVRKHRFPPQMDSFPEHCVIALNSEGLHFLGAEERDTLASFGYADIYRWGGSSTQFSIIIWNAESEDTDDVAMFTCQAADMAALILDYINAIMATTEQ